MLIDANRALSTMALMAVLADLTGAASAQTSITPGVEAGASLARTLCSGCHLMDGATESNVPAGVPTLRGIANKEGQTGQKVFDVLIQPHPPMPDLSLSVGEIQSLIFYLESLRMNPAVPPLIVPREQLKIPSYPRPS